MREVEILWTGGFDSSFRMMQLSYLECTIQPYYLPDNRASEQKELAAIAKITELLLSRKSTKCVINDPKIVKTSEVAEDQEISNAFNKILAKDFFGSQYDWLARFAKNHPGIELSIHKDDKATGIIQKYGRVIEKNDLLSYFIIDKENSPNDINLLFGNYHFPLLTLSKLEMQQIYEQSDMMDIANTTWFCYRPIKGNPCGQCNPCMYTIQEGLKDRFTFSALIRYRVAFIRKEMKKILRSVKSKYLTRN